MGLEVQGRRPPSRSYKSVTRDQLYKKYTEQNTLHLPAYKPDDDDSDDDDDCLPAYILYTLPTCQDPEVYP